MVEIFMGPIAISEMSTIFLWAKDSLIKYGKAQDSRIGFKKG